MSNEFKLKSCLEGYGHSGHWCGPAYECWLDPRDRDVQERDFEDRKARSVAEDIRDLLAAAPQPPALGGEPEIEYPEFHAGGMGCGLEDKGIMGRYDAMRYGWDEALERCASEVVAPLQAEIERLKLAEKNDAIAYKAAIQRQEEIRAHSFEMLCWYNAAINERDQLQARCDALEGLLRAHAGHVAGLCDVMFRFGLGEYKEPKDTIYAALEGQQQVNVALSKPAGSES